MSYRKDSPSAVKAAVTILGALVIQACATSPDAAKVGPFPSNYKETVKQYALDYYYDPYSLRSVEITRPSQARYMFQQGWGLCLRANAKNRMGGYVGVESTFIIINNGEIIGTLEDHPDCRGAQGYEPWPELENL